jgi:hypothetical protein
VLLGKDGPVRKTFATKRATDTDFRVRGKFDRIRILVCNIHRGDVKCDDTTHRRDRDFDRDRDFGRDRIGARTQSAKKRAVKEQGVRKHSAALGP